MLVQRLLKEDIDTYVERSKLIETVELSDEGIAIAKGQEQVVYGPVLIAQTADILTDNARCCSFICHCITCRW